MRTHPVNGNLLEWVEIDGIRKEMRVRAINRSADPDYPTYSSRTEILEFDLPEGYVAERTSDGRYVARRADPEKPRTYSYDDWIKDRDSGVTR